MKNIKLYVDDLRDCPVGYEVARNVEEALTFLKDPEINVTVISLDHDLGEKDGKLLPDGFDLVQEFAKQGLRADKIYIHTMNSVGREKMYTSLLSYIRHGLIDSDIKVYNYSITPDTYTETEGGW